jgi:hypothetical protein
MSLYWFKTARFVENKIRARNCILGKKIGNRGFIESIRRRHTDCKKSVVYEANY